jgi:predicted nuclease with RNAse H fold
MRNLSSSVRKGQGLRSRVRFFFNHLLHFIPGKGISLIFIGLDLAGSQTRPTGFCALDAKMTCTTRLLYSDEEILAETMALGPSVVSIDAPLFLPKGRKDIEARGPPHLRACDRELLKMRIKFFPISLGPMRKLTTRGMLIRGMLEARKLTVIESFPGAIQDILDMPRKQKGIENLRHALSGFGVKGHVLKKDITHHELDAITSAIVGKMYFDGNYHAIGDPDEGYMILPASEDLGKRKHSDNSTSAAMPGKS